MKPWLQELHRDFTSIASAQHAMPPRLEAPRQSSGDRRRFAIPASDAKTADSPVLKDAAAPGFQNAAA